MSRYIETAFADWDSFLAKAADYTSHHHGYSSQREEYGDDGWSVLTPQTGTLFNEAHGINAGLTYK